MAEAAWQGFVGLRPTALRQGWQPAGPSVGSLAGQRQRAPPWEKEEEFTLCGMVDTSRLGT